MKRILTILIFGLIYFNGQSQTYNPVVTYSYNGTPSQGIKIKTQLPYSNGTQMPTVIIEGYNYGQVKPIGLILTWYIYDGSFYSPKISSFGDYIPAIKLANENGLVVIFIDDKQYYNRFSVRAFAQGMSEQSSWFSNWSISDEALTGSNITTVPYANTFAGNINFPSGIWNENGFVGIGTSSPGARLHINQSGGAWTDGLRLTQGSKTWDIVVDSNGDRLLLCQGQSSTGGITITNGNVGIGVASAQNKLDVNGIIRAKEIKVETGWADFVFHPSYQLKPLIEVEKYIKANGHLQDIPSATEVEQNGVNVGEMQKKLLQKVEELTLYMIEKDKQLEEQMKINLEQQQLLCEMKKEIELLKKK